MTTTAWIIIAFVVFDLIVAFIVARGFTKSMFGELGRIYPPTEPGYLEHDRRAQSFSVGLLNFGFSVRVRVDERSVHLSPEPWMFWTGMPKASIPIEKIKATGQAKKSWMAHSFEIDSDRSHIELRGPKWLWSLLEAGTASN